MTQHHPTAYQVGIFLLQVIIRRPYKLDVVLLRHLDVLPVLRHHAAGQHRQRGTVLLHAGIQEKRVLLGGLQHAAHTLLIVFHSAGKAINAIAVHPGGNTALLGAGIALQVAIQHGHRVAGTHLRAQLHMAVQLRCKG